MATAFLGMRGNADWVSGEQEGSYRRGILELQPNGHSPMVAISSLAGSSPIPSTTHSWWTRKIATQSGAVTNIYIDSGMATAYVKATHGATIGIKGKTVYAKVAEATADMIRPGHAVLLSDSDRYDVDVVGKVTAVDKNGASSKISIKLLEADDNSATTATYNLATVDRIRVIGNRNAQGGTMPNAITYEPSKVTNVCPIWRTPIDLTMSAYKEQTLLTGRDPLMDAKTQALLYHGKEMEMDMIFSVYDADSLGENGKPEYSMMGIRQFIKTYASDNVDDFTLNSSYTAKTWNEAGLDYLDSIMSNLFSWTPDQPGNLGTETRLAFVGPGALRGLNAAIKADGASRYEISKMQTDGTYGIKFQTLESVFGTLMFKVHPLFNLETTLSYAMLVYEPRNVMFMPYRDTQYYSDPAENGETTSLRRADKIEGEYLTEGTIELKFPETMGYYTGIGQDNTLS